MPDEITELFEKSGLSFVGTVTRLGGTRMASVPADERTAVVRVSQVLHAPEAFRRLAGSEVTVRLADGTAPPAVGDTAAFFTNGAAYGEGLAVHEVGRLPAEAVQPQVSLVARTTDAMPFSGLERRAQDAGLVAHADQADAVVVGVVVGLEQLSREQTGTEHVSEHTPDWWLARLDVTHVEQGDVAEGRLTVLYPNSEDVHWSMVPKPRAAEEGMWLLHATAGALAELAPFQILDPDDYQPVHRLDTLQAARR